MPPRTTRHSRLLVCLTLLLLLVPVGAAARPVEPRGPAIGTGGRQKTPINGSNPRQPRASVGSDADPVYERDDWFYSLRTAGTAPFSVADAAAARARAAAQVTANANSLHPSAVSNQWIPQGPNPIVDQSQATNEFITTSGRVSALAIRSTTPYTIYLGAAQGGIWISSTLTTQWQSKGDQFASLAIGALALAPSNENVIYAGTGEGNLSGDSYYGNGILKSTDAGNTWNEIGGSAFNEVSIAKIVVDPLDPNHLYVATLRGRGGARRTSPPNPTPYGIYESTDGGNTWAGRKTTTNPANGATDLVMDPQNPRLLYAAFWGEGIWKSADGGVTWQTAMNGLPTADYAAVPSRFALAISHPPGTLHATLYTGFDYDIASSHHPAVIYRSTDDAASWTLTSSGTISGSNPDAVGDYCAQQCYYDNIVAADPTNPNIVYALGQWNYSTGTGGIYRSLDGGSTWKDLGYNLHPDFHAIAIRNRDPGNPVADGSANIVIGNDGGVWSSSSRGGRLVAGTPLAGASWSNLNGTVKLTPIRGAGLQIAQFSSAAQHPTQDLLFGGTQDNGTLRRAALPLNGSQPFTDMTGGDGGQVLVDPFDPSFVYGTYYDVSPYRFTDGMNTIEGNRDILSGLNTNDRSDFYVPFAMDPSQTQRLFLGSFRVYRTDNHGTLWQAISGDLTTGCLGVAPNGARNCSISAFGLSAGSSAMYAGTLDGLVWVTPDPTASRPIWLRIDRAPLPARPVTAIAVDRSNYRVAYVAYASFNGATPPQPGHVFRTTDAGQSWTDVSGNLPDVPVNSLVLDPVDANTLYAGTDVGALVTTDGGKTWNVLGSNLPRVAVWQLDYNPFHHRLAAGTHGRGMWTLTDAAGPAPAIQLRLDAIPATVAPGDLITYTLTLKNLGDAAANGLTLTDPIPANTTFAGASNGGTLTGNTVIWPGLNIPAATTGAGPYFPLVPSVTTVTLTVRVGAPGTFAATSIMNDGAGVQPARGSTIFASPFQTAVSGLRKVAIPLVRKQ